MEFWKNLLAFFEAEMPEPASFGWFHFMWVVIIAAFTVFMCIKFKDCSDKTLRLISLIVFITLVVFDLYKQITYDWVEYDEATDKFVWDYAWPSFPFQLCSSPHYILPFVIWLPDGKVRDAFVGFMSFFSLVGGLCVFVYPESCFTEFIGVNIQTMLHHGMQITLGVFYAVHERRKYNIRYYLRSTPVFFAYFGIAMLLNVVVHHALRANGMDDTFNMLYISPYHESDLPIFDIISVSVPYPVLLISYLEGLMIASLIVYGVVYGIMLLSKKKTAGKSYADI